MINIQMFFESKEVSPLLHRSIHEYQFKAEKSDQITELERQIDEFVNQTKMSSVIHNCDIFTHIEHTYLHSLQKTEKGSQIIAKTLCIIGNVEAPARVRLLYLYAHSLYGKEAQVSNLLLSLSDCFYVNLKLKNKLQVGYKAGILYALISVGKVDVEKAMNYLIIYLEDQVDFHMVGKKKNPPQNFSRKNSVQNIKSIYIGASLKHKSGKAKKQKTKFQKYPFYLLLFESYLIYSFRSLNSTKKAFYQLCRQQLRSKIIREFPGLNIQQRLMMIELNRGNTLREFENYFKKPNDEKKEQKQQYISKEETVSQLTKKKIYSRINLRNSSLHKPKEGASTTTGQQLKYQTQMPSKSAHISRRYFCSQDQRGNFNQQIKLDIKGIKEEKVDASVTSSQMASHLDFGVERSLKSINERFGGKANKQVEGRKSIDRKRLSLRRNEEKTELNQNQFENNSKIQKQQIARFNQSSHYENFNKKHTQNKQNTEPKSKPLADVRKKKIKLNFKWQRNSQPDCTQTLKSEIQQKSSEIEQAFSSQIAQSIPLEEQKGDKLLMIAEMSPANQSASNEESVGQMIENDYEIEQPQFTLSQPPTLPMFNPISLPSLNKSQPALRINNSIICISIEPVVPQSEIKKIVFFELNSFESNLVDQIIKDEKQKQKQKQKQYKENRLKQQEEKQNQLRDLYIKALQYQQIAEYLQNQIEFQSQISSKANETLSEKRTEIRKRSSNLNLNDYFSSFPEELSQIKEKVSNHYLEEEEDGVQLKNQINNKCDPLKEETNEMIICEVRNSLNEMYFSQEKMLISSTKQFLDIFEAQEIKNDIQQEAQVPGENERKQSICVQMRFNPLTTSKSIGKRCEIIQQQPNEGNSGLYAVTVGGESYNFPMRTRHSKTEKKIKIKTIDDIAHDKGIIFACTPQKRKSITEHHIAQNLQNISILQSVPTISESKLQQAESTQINCLKQPQIAAPVKSTRMIENASQQNLYRSKHQSLSICFDPEFNHVTQYYRKLNHWLLPEIFVYDNLITLTITHPTTNLTHREVYQFNENGLNYSVSDLSKGIQERVGMLFNRFSAQQYNNHDQNKWKFIIQEMKKLDLQPKSVELVSMTVDDGTGASFEVKLVLKKDQNTVVSQITDYPIIKPISIPIQQNQRVQQILAALHSKNIKILTLNDKIPSLILTDLWTTLGQIDIKLREKQIAIQIKFTILERAIFSQNDGLTFDYEIVSKTHRLTVHFQSIPQKKRKKVHHNINVILGYVLKIKNSSPVIADANIQALIDMI